METTRRGQDEPGTGDRVIAFATWLLALLGAGMEDDDQPAG
jgi:hypothetical protein